MSLRNVTVLSFLSNSPYFNIEWQLSSSLHVRAATHRPMQPFSLVILGLMMSFLKEEEE